MKVQLIQPTIGKYLSNSRTGCYAPVGLVSIATYLRQSFPGVEIEILDGELLSSDALNSKIDADFVGINSNTVTYPEALKVAELAKSQGSKVILGGVYASAIPEIILKNRPHLFDSVVVGYGEKPFEQIINGRNDRIIVNQKPEFNELPLPDRSIIDLDSYLERFQLSHPTWKYRATNIFSNVGCTWRSRGGGCLFCSRSGDQPFFKKPELVWKEVRELVENYNINYLVDFSDSILQNPTWLKALVASKPKDLNPNWHVFGRVDEISRESLTLLRQLPCDHIFVGIETGDDKIYRSINKGGGSPSESLEKAKLMVDMGFEITPSYVLGLPGETETSLNNTLAHANQLKELTSFEEIFCCNLIPFPGSNAFNAIINQSDHFIFDIFSVKSLSTRWISAHSLPNLRMLNYYIDSILMLGKYKITITDYNSSLSSTRSTDRIPVYDCI